MEDRLKLKAASNLIAHILISLATSKLKILSVLGPAVPELHVLQYPNASTYLREVC